MSDPSTKDLIAAAREHSYPCEARHHVTECPNCLGHALADRLGAVEEERSKLWDQVQKVARERDRYWSKLYRFGYIKESPKPEGGDADDADEQPAADTQAAAPRSETADVTPGESWRPGLGKARLSTPDSPEPSEPEHQHDRRLAAFADRLGRLESLVVEVRDRLTTLEEHT